MNSDARLTVSIVCILCFLVGFVATQIKGCQISENEVKKLNEANAVRMAEQATKAKADCLNAGGSYDDRGACYRSAPALAK